MDLMGNNEIPFHQEAQKSLCIAEVDKNGLQHSGDIALNSRTLHKSQEGKPLKRKQRL
jgi:hypothetical protein